MLERAREAGIPARWVAADEVYGGHDLRIRICTPTATLADPGSTGGDGFGSSLAVHGDSAIAVAWGTLGNFIDGGRGLHLHALAGQGARNPCWRSRPRSCSISSLS